MKIKDEALAYAKMVLDAIRDHNEVPIGGEQFGNMATVMEAQDRITTALAAPVPEVIHTEYELQYRRTEGPGGMRLATWTKQRGFGAPEDAVAIASVDPDTFPELTQARIVKRTDAVLHTFETRPAALVSAMERAEKVIGSRSDGLAALSVPDLAVLLAAAKASTNAG
jgi:hypothetical protein